MTFATDIHRIMPGKGMMIELTNVQWISVILAAGLIGFSKTGIPGAGILVVPLLAAVMPARQSTGFLLPILCLADILAILYWRKHVEWKQLGRLLPSAVVGIAAGFFAMGKITDRQLMPLIGILILALLVLTIWRNRRTAPDSIPTSRSFAAGMGILAGITTMMANAAGPITNIYLLAMKLDKKQFIGTAAWFFWAVNLIKIPFSLKLQLITPNSLLTNLALLPAILTGGLAGICLMHRIPQNLFNAAITGLAVFAAAYLCLKPLLG